MATPKPNWKRRWAQLRRFMRDERFLAAVNHGMTKELDPKKHRDILDKNKGRVEILDKLLREMRTLTQRGDWR